MAEAIALAKKAKQEEMLRQRATLARAERAKLMASSISQFNSEVRKGDNDEKQGDLESHLGKKRKNEDREIEDAVRERNELRHQRKREIERDRRLEVAGKKNTTGVRDEDRDISEKIALGQAQPTSRDAMYDQRLFN